MYGHMTYMIYIHTQLSLTAKVLSFSQENLRESTFSESSLDTLIWYLVVKE